MGVVFPLQPMSLAIIPDGRILLVVRNGALLIFKPDLNTAVLGESA
jgi:hypothetical protein